MKPAIHHPPAACSTGANGTGCRPMYDVLGSGRGFCVVKDGQPMGPVRSSLIQAWAVAERLERAAKTRQRRCMCCREWFRSEGPHNRLCDPCRRWGDHR